MPNIVNHVFCLLKYIWWLNVYLFSTPFNLPSYTAPIARFFRRKILYILWSFLCHVWWQVQVIHHWSGGQYYVKFGNIGIHNKKRISQVKIIFKQKLYLEIAGHVSELNKSIKKNSASKYFLNGEKRGSQYWAYDLYSHVYSCFRPFGWSFVNMIKEK